MTSSTNFMIENEIKNNSKINGRDEIVYFPHGVNNELYLSTVNEISGKSHLSFFVSEDEIICFKKLMEEFGKGTRKEIDYDRFFLVFNKMYFFKNLYKVFVSLDFLKSHKFIVSTTYSSVIDIGCGAGVGTIAWIKLFGKGNTKHILIDKNKCQLDLAKNIVQIFENNIFEFYNSSYPKDFDKLSGIKLFSYWFCEQKCLENTLHEQDLNEFVGDGVLIIDYKHNIDLIQKLISSEYLFKKWTLKIRKIPCILCKGEEDEQDVHFAFIKRF